MVDIAGERRRLADVGFTHRLRDEWGASWPYADNRAVEDPATRLFLHITVTNPDNYRSNDAHARAIEAIGIARFPATGISYNELLMPGGLLYEAQPLGRRGAHTINAFERTTCILTTCPGRGGPLFAPSWNLNVNSRALALARNVDDPVTDADVDAAAQWGAAVKLAGFVTRDARWHGHRCVSAKACPGDKGWARLGDIADLTADYVRTGLPGEAMTPDQMAELKAHITTEVNAVAAKVWAHRLDNRVTADPDDTTKAGDLLSRIHEDAFLIPGHENQFVGIRQAIEELETAITDPDTPPA